LYERAVDTWHHNSNNDVESNTPPTKMILASIESSDQDLSINVKIILIGGVLMLL
jgi:hypothetical protein